MKELGDDVTDEEKTAIEKASDELKAALKDSKEKDEIEAKIEDNASLIKIRSDCTRSKAPTLSRHSLRHRMVVLLMPKTTWWMLSLKKLKIKTKTVNKSINTYGISAVQHAALCALGTSDGTHR